MWSTRWVYYQWFRAGSRAFADSEMEMGKFSHQLEVYETDLNLDSDSSERHICFCLQFASSAQVLYLIMRSSFILVDFDKNFHKYLVKVKDVVNRPIAPVPLSDNPILHSTPEFFWFLQNLRNDQDFRLRVRNQLKSRNRPTVFQLSEPYWMIDFKRYNNLI